MTWWKSRYLITQILDNFEVTSKAHCILKFPDCVCSTCKPIKFLVSLYLSDAISSYCLQPLCCTGRLSLTQLKHAQQLSFKLFFLVLVAVKELVDISEGYRSVHGTSHMLVPILKSWFPDSFNNFGDAKVWFLCLVIHSGCLRLLSIVCPNTLES